MNCPRCETTELNQRDRQGVSIDNCPRCHGVWLDRGELDKLIARSREDDGDLRDDDDDDHDDRERRGSRGRRRSSFWDLFD